MTVKDAEADFRRFYNSVFKQGRKGMIKVIHGFGSSGQGGVIRSRLRGLMFANRSAMTIVLGEAYDNPGVTFVEPRRLIPTSEDRLAGEVVAFCSTPKPYDRIEKKFARHGAAVVRKTVESLIRNGSLTGSMKRGMKQYVACHPEREPTRRE